MYTIKRATLEGLLEAAANTYPNEFFALLGSSRKNNVIDEVVIVPAVYGRSHTLVKTGHIPLDLKVMGSIHSHPGPSAKPSKADLHSFPAFGSIHLIISHPFSMNSVAAYDVAGHRIEVKVAE